MVRIHLEGLLPGANKKLHPRNAGPFKVLKKLSSNAYTLELPSDIGINLQFCGPHTLTMGMTMMKNLKNKPLLY